MDQTVKQPAARLESIQIGQPQTRLAAHSGDGRPREWRSAIFKTPVEGSVAVRQDGLVGDAQVNRQNHGGVDKALLAYAAAHYEHWNRELPDHDWRYGGFGENLTISGLDETSVCLADTYRIGEVLVEVSQPREPCWKLCRLWDQPDLAKRVVRSGRTGWYLRVLESGVLHADLKVVLVDRPCKRWTIDLANRLMSGQEIDPEAAEALSRLPQLSLSWRENLISKQLL